MRAVNKGRRSGRLSWTELLAAHADFANTDDLAGLEAFLGACGTA